MEYETDIESLVDEEIVAPCVAMFLSIDEKKGREFVQRNFDLLMECFQTGVRAGLSSARKVVSAK